MCVLDRAPFPRDKTCAGWITPPVFQALGVEPAEYAQGRTLQPIQGFRVTRIGEIGSRARFGRTVSYGIRRCELDHFLLDAPGRRCTRSRCARSNGRATSGA